MPGQSTLWLPTGAIRKRLSAAEGANGTTTITRAATSDGWFSSAEPIATVALDPARTTADYHITWEVMDADDVGAVGDVIVYDKATNGFKIKFTGSTDNVEILWKLTEIA